MQELHERIAHALEGELSAIYDELNIRTGDITPEQWIELDRLTGEIASLFSELIEQNKPL